MKTLLTVCGADTVRSSTVGLLHLSIKASLQSLHFTVLHKKNDIYE